jgi:GNAT superfamily N-acetyltransferase
MPELLKVEFIHVSQIPPELDRAIEALDQLAFAGDDDGPPDPEFGPIDWSTPHEWNALGWLDGQLVSQLCLLRREILVGEERVWVAGIGGVATHPQWQHKGLASQLLRATADFIRAEIHTPFGVLLCAEATRPFYEKAGWQLAAAELFFTQNGARRTMKTCVMVMNFTEKAFPEGMIDLCGLVW